MASPSRRDPSEFPGWVTDLLVFGGALLAAWGLWQISRAVLACVVGGACIGLGMMLVRKERRRGRP